MISGKRGVRVDHNDCPRLPIFVQLRKYELGRLAGRRRAKRRKCRAVTTMASGASAPNSTWKNRSVGRYRHSAIDEGTILVGPVNGLWVVTALLVMGLYTMQMLSFTRQKLAVDPFCGVLPRLRFKRRPVVGRGPWLDETLATLMFLQ